MAYWLARYLHDLVFYLPISYVVSKMIVRFDDYMEYASTVVML